MNTLRLLLHKMTWQGLVILTVALLGIGLNLLGSLFVWIENQYLIALILLGLGSISVGGGYLVTRIVGYELCPRPRQVTGALLVGAAVAVMAYSSLELISTSETLETGVVLLLVSVLFFVEFITIRIAQSKTITSWQVLSFIPVSYVVVSHLRELSADVFVFGWIIFASGLAALVISRIGQTYLISPWVNSFWNGWAFLVVGALLVPLTSASTVFTTIYEVSLLPVWLGVMVGLLSLSVLIFKQLKHKLRISKGYMQYKLQSLTILLAVVAMIITETVSIEILFAYLSIIAAYSIAEKRLIINE